MKKARIKKIGEEGITLVALVITVIIMLILAGVAISAIMNGEGLFEKTQIATDSYGKAVQNETEQITSLMSEIDKYLGLPPARVKAASIVSVGDYINYDAGTWTTADLAKITSSAGNPTLHSTVNDGTLDNQAVPDEQGQFGGFELDNSRNENSIAYDNNGRYKPRTSGWRVWDIHEARGVVTLISAGNPETYLHLIGKEEESENILKNRNCSMYENSHAQAGSAHILTGPEVAAWYNKQYGTSYKLERKNGVLLCTLSAKQFSKDGPIDVLENGSHYWLALANNTGNMFSVQPSRRSVFQSCGFAFGVRPLVTLKTDTLLEQGTGDGSFENPWKIVDSTGDLPQTEEDTIAPTLSTVASSIIEQTTFTLTATGEDETGIVKYEFYINNILENTVQTTEGTATNNVTECKYEVNNFLNSFKRTATYNVTGKTVGTTYTCKVRVYDAAGNYKESSEISVTTQTPGPPIRVASVVSVGDYINYDAGIWTTADLAKITSSTGNPTLHSTVNDGTSNNQAVPNVQGRFGGFELGQSRNTNSTEWNSSYKPRTDGWRVWDINETTKVVTLISAGHPETYYHANGESVASINILRNRNCSMYENSHAQTGSAHILTGQEAAAWYNKQYGTNYTIIENGEYTSTFMNETFSTNAPIDVFENGSYYWLASAYNANYLYCVDPRATYVYDKSYVGLGIRLLVSLKSDTLLVKGTGDGGFENPWVIVEN